MATMLPRSKDIRVNRLSIRCGSRGQSCVNPVGLTRIFTICNARSYPEYLPSQWQLTVFVRDGGTGIQWSKKWAYSPHTRFKCPRREALLRAREGGNAHG